MASDNTFPTSPSIQVYPVDLVQHAAALMNEFDAVKL